MKSKIRQLYGITAFYAIPIVKRNWIWMLTSLIMPFSFFVMFYFIGGKDLSMQAPIGALAVLSFNAGLVNLPQYMLMSKFRKLHYYFVSAPISPVLYNAAIALAMLIPMIPDLIVMIILCYLLGARFSIVGILSLILVILLTWAVGSLLGFYIGTRVSNAMYISAIANTAGLLLETLPPVYYPLNYVSFAWKDVLLLIPTVSAAHLMRWLMESIKMPRVEAIYAFIILFVYILVFIILVQRKAEWMER